MAKGIIREIDPRTNNGTIRESNDGYITTYDIPQGYADPKESRTFNVNDPVDFTINGQPGSPDSFATNITHDIGGGGRR